MKKRILCIILALFSIRAASGEEPIANPIAEYSVSGYAEALVESVYPRAVFPPNNAQLSERARILNEALRSSRSANDSMLALQRRYDADLQEFVAIIAKDGDESGVLQNLTWDPKVPDTIVQGEPIPLSLKLLCVQDPTQLPIPVKCSLYKRFMLSSIRLTKADEAKSPVMLSKVGTFEFFRSSIDFMDVREALARPDVQAVRNTPSHSKEINVLQDYSYRLNLAKLYDLYEPGEYELTFFTRRFADEEGNPAANPVREYPAPKTVSFTVTPKQEQDARSSALTYRFDSPQEARKERAKPALTRIPDNFEVQARIEALTASGVAEDDWSANLHNMAAYYEQSLDLLVEKLGASYDDANTKKFSGLEWRVAVPEETPSGSPVHMTLGLKNISETDCFRICKKDAMTSFAMLASIRIARIGENGENEDVPLTREGAESFFTPSLLHENRMPPYVTFDDIKILPNQTVVFPIRGFLARPGIDLTELFNLSKQGEYELTFYTRRFLDDEGNPARDQQRKYPCSDTVRFRITDPAENR